MFFFSILKFLNFPEDQNKYKHVLIVSKNIYSNYITYVLFRRTYSNLRIIMKHLMKPLFETD